VRLLSPPAGLESATVYFSGVGYSMYDAGDRWYRLIGLETDTPVGGYPIEVDGPSGVIAAGTLTISEGGFQFESIEIPPSSTDLLQDQAAVDAERETLNAIYAGFTPVKMWDGAWSWPAEGWISNAFGLQRSINGGPYYPHSGTDIANEKGTPLMAAASGTVVLARAMYLYGNVVVIDHGLGVYTSYNHMDSIAVVEGQSVTEGEYLGAMGETGFVNGPHVHWEAIISGVRTDATLWTLGPVEP
jgi:murein DD-endopeptidase MepM/ murein hydrolase activator NlpD